MICAGIGCRRGTSAETVLSLLERALEIHGVPRSRLGAIATVPLKREEPALHKVAEVLGVPLIVAGRLALETAQARCLSHSKASMRATGAASVSEAAALAVCGGSSRLFGPRLAEAGATCALAISGEGA